MIFKTKSGQQNHFTASVLAFDTSSFIDGNIEQKKFLFFDWIDANEKKKNHETHRLYIIFYMILFSV